MSLKDIKSKKQKLDQKKVSKRSITPMIDLIQSSGSSIELLPNEKIEKRSKYSGKRINPSNSSTNQLLIPKPNVLNLDVIRNINETKKLGEKYLSNRQQKDDQLLVEQSIDPDPMGPTNDRSLFSYKMQGRQGLKYISKSHMSGKIVSEIKQMQRKINDQIKKQLGVLQRILDGEEEQKQKEEKEDKKEGKRPSRYFDEQLSEGEEDPTKIIKCYRCGLKGHIARHCFEDEARVQCHFCLGNHHHNNCNTNPCFKCTKIGHISQDCESKEIQCLKCRKKGHKAKDCGVFLYLDYHLRKDDQIKNRFSLSDLKHLKCLNGSCKRPQGHFNCFNYNTSKELQPYYKSHEKTYQKQNDYYRRK